MWPIIIKVLVVLGTAIVKALISRVLLIILKALLVKIKARLKEFMKAKVSKRVVAYDVKKLTNEMRKSKNSSNHMTMSELEELLVGDGVVLADVNQNNEVDTSTIEIISADNADNEFTNLMQQKQGFVLFNAA